MLLHGAVRDAGVGESIRIEATDPSTERDIPKFCNFLGHELRRAWRDGDLYLYEVVKGAG